MQPYPRGPDAYVTIAHQAHIQDTETLGLDTARTRVFSHRISFSWLYTEGSRFEIWNVLLALRWAFWRLAHGWVSVGLRAEALKRTEMRWKSQ